MVIEQGMVIPQDSWLRKYYWDFQKSAKHCCRCSACKWINAWEIKDARFARVCPSSSYYLFDAYSCQGRMDVALALIDGRLKYEDSPGLLDVVYRCQTCGGCDVQCKSGKDMEPLRVMLEMRANLVEDGQLLPQHMTVLDSLKREDNTMMGKKADRGNWAKDMEVKNLTQEAAAVAFHCGCEISFDQDLWKVARAAVTLLKEAGVDVGIMGKDETCCGAKMFDLGYRSDFLKYAENNMDAWRNAGVKTVVVACADGYYAIKRLYPEIGSNFEVYHILQYIDKLIKEGKLKLTKPVNMKVTWHDPCHIGRRDSDRIYVPGKAIIGLYEEPRDILKAIPELEFVEMFRIKEYAWCCGAGGGVRETYPDFSLWTTTERVLEAKAVGAEAIVTACPWCERALLDAIEKMGGDIKVYDIVELIQMAK